ncbi:hypothetical protein B0H21DRAFT_585064 [Amylocystis lapponica]|nr:hypothetical protein B0H21DRAFT_585064 [Amylocystis lapponica]
MVEAVNPPMSLLAGPQLLGIMFMWGLQGAMLVQVYIYSVYSHSSPMGWKCFTAYLIFIADLVQIGLKSAFAYHVYVGHHSDIVSVTTVSAIWTGAAALEGLIGWAVQLFFAWRIWIVSKKKTHILVGSIVTLSVAQTILGFVSLVLSERDTSMEAKKGVDPILGVCTCAPPSSSDELD